MADAHVYYDEIRINVADPELTQIYVYVRCEGDCPHTVQGWYHKTFPSYRTAQDLMREIWDEEGGVLYWGKKAP